MSSIKLFENRKVRSHTITHSLFNFKGAREPQAVCHVAPAKAQTKTWRQRVS
jgi:hypothetical protein